MPEGILFYNQIITPFFTQHFHLHLHDLLQTLRHVLPIFALEIKEVVSSCEPVVERCQMVIKQYDNIVLEKFYQFVSDGVYPNLQISMEPRHFSGEDVFQKHFNELISF